MEKINIDLYGGKSIFGGREEPLNADITYCDRFKECSFYKKGKCFCAGRIGPNCKYGTKEYVKGYTSRAIKYNEFRRKYKEDECYAKLDEPKSKIGKIGDTFVINMRYLHEKDEGGYEITTNIFSHPLIYIQEKEFTNTLISLICDGKPRTFFENEIIKDYVEKDVPRFLYELKKEFNEIYEDFINEYPEYEDKEMNFVGRKAYIYSLKDGIELEDNKATFVKQGKYLKSITNYKSYFLPFGAKEAELIIKINPKMTFKITDNSQVDDNTEFED